MSSEIADKAMNLKIMSSRAFAPYCFPSRGGAGIYACPTIPNCCQSWGGAGLQACGIVLYPSAL